MAKKLTKEEFIQKAIRVHGNRYDYSNVEYVNARTDIQIICPIHGIFLQTPDKHLNGQGCPKCAGKNKTVDEFIKKARQVHGNKYDYSNVKYVNNKTKVCIICSEHGEFWQTPHNHLRGQGCPECRYIKSAKSNCKNCDNVINDFIKVHGNKYDYSKVNYVNSKIKVCIICPEHGVFEQTSHDHLAGKGCPKCKQSHLERDVMKLLEENNINYEYQKRFEWLGRQSLDFYLPDYNIAIECQGGQHFKSVDYFGGERDFIKRIKRDENKKLLCENNNIKIFYFSNLNIETFLDVNIIRDKNTLLEKIIIK